MAVMVLGLVVLMAVVFNRSARLRFLADDYSYLARVQPAGWWHSGSTTWNSGGQLFRPMLYLWVGAVDDAFGLHPLPFHLAAGLLLLMAGIMTGLVARRLGLRLGAYAAAAVVCLHGSMMTVVGWASAANSPLATALALGAVYCMLRARLRARDVALACVLFVSAVLTREAVAVTPAILVITRFLVEPDGRWWMRLKRSVVVSLPLWTTFVFYAVVRRLTGGAASGPYEQRLTAQSLTNLGRLLQIATDLRLSDPHLYTASVATFWLVLIVVCTVAALRSHRRQGLVGLAWAFIGVLPVVFLAVHPMEYYYVDFALPGLAIAIGTVVEWLAALLPDRIGIAFAFACLAVLVVVSFGTARKDQREVLDGEVRRTTVVVEQIRRDYTNPAKGTNIVVHTDARHRALDFYLTAGGDLVRVIYHDPTLTVTYEIDPVTP